MLSTSEQAEMIAIYRVQNQIDGVQAYEQHADAKRARRRAQMKG